MGPLTFGLIVANASFGTAWLTSAAEAALAVGLMAGGGALLRRERAAAVPAEVEPAARPEGVLG